MFTREDHISDLKTVWYDMISILWFYNNPPSGDHSGESFGGIVAGIVDQDYRCRKYREFDVWLNYSIVLKFTVELPKRRVKVRRLVGTWVAGGIIGFKSR